MEQQLMTQEKIEKKKINYKIWFALFASVILSMYLIGAIMKQAEEIAEYNDNFKTAGCDAYIKRVNQPYDIKNIADYLNITNMTTTPTTLGDNK